MNKAKLAGLYPFYLDCLRTHAAQPHRSLLDMMEIKLRCELLVPGAPARRYWVALRDQENPQRRFDQLGLPTDELLREQVPARVFNWVQLQLLALPASTDLELLLAPATGWRASARASTPEQGMPGQLVPAASEREADVHVERLASASDLTPLMRGMQAYQTKRRKQARRLLAQLWAYHWQQQTAQQQVPVAAPVSKEVCVTPPVPSGVLPRLVKRLRRGLAAKVHQVAIATEAILAEGGVAA